MCVQVYMFWLGNHYPKKKKYKGGRGSTEQWLEFDISPWLLIFNRYTFIMLDRFVMFNYIISLISSWYRLHWFWSLAIWLWVEATWRWTLCINLNCEDLNSWRYSDSMVSVYNEIHISLGRPEVFEKLAKIGVGVHIWLLKVSKLTHH